MKFLLSAALLTFLGNAFAVDVMVCNANLMSYSKGEFAPYGEVLMKTVATRSFAQGHGAIYTVASGSMIYDETVIPLDRNGKPKKDAKKEEVIISMGHIMNSSEGNESLKVVLFRMSELNKHGVHTKSELLGEVELSGIGASKVAFVDKYAVQLSCDVADKP